jgi:spermidine dehydrogenase
MNSAAYPPGLTGIQGSNNAAVRTTNQLVWEGRRFARPDTQTDGDYDLVIVGAGLSGLSAAWFYRQQRPDTKILILDNHNDFGGHAKRDEFKVNGQTLLISGGSFLLSHPDGFPDEVKGLLSGVGIELERFAEFYDAEFFDRNGLSDGVFFPARGFGKDVLSGNVLSMMRTTFRTTQERMAYVDAYPVSDRDKAAFNRLITGDFEFLPEATPEERSAVLSQMPAADFMCDVLGFEEKGLLYLQNLPKALAAYGLDILSAQDMINVGFMGQEKGWALAQTGRGDGFGAAAEPLVGQVIHHFPDGNAGVARMIVRNLIPEVAPGTSMESIVLAPFDYSKLDLPENDTRLRLNSPVVEMTNVNGGVDITYVANDAGETHRVHAKHAIMAGYNGMIPYLCPETPRSQAQALSFGEKVPMCYVNVALNNWRPIKKSGFARIYSPDSFFCNIWMDYAVNMGGYEFAKTPDDPVALILHYMPSASDTYATPREQAREGRRRLMGHTFEKIEAEARAYLTEVWGPYGFDFDRDVEAITVNRWLHGYAPTYQDRWSLGVPKEGPEAPHVIGRQPIGNIYIANSDSEAHAFFDAAAMAAYRSVSEVLR